MLLLVYQNGYTSMGVGFCYLDCVIPGITIPAPVCSGPLTVPGETDNFTLGLRSAGQDGPASFYFYCLFI